MKQVFGLSQELNVDLLRYLPNQRYADVAKLITALQNLPVINLTMEPQVKETKADGNQPDAPQGS